MWRVWHHLFGWDYVCYTHIASRYIRRVRVSPNKEFVYVKVEGIRLINDSTAHQWEKLT